MWSLILMLWFIPTAPIDAQAVNLDGPYPDRTQVWEPLVAYVWDAWDRQDVDVAMRVLHCESRGYPNAHNDRVYENPKDQASGLFQHMPRWWDHRVEQNNLTGHADIFNPFYNVWISAWLVDKYSCVHWECW